jgi:hypothetical protein
MRKDEVRVQEGKKVLCEDLWCGSDPKKMRGVIQKKMQRERKGKTERDERRDLQNKMKQRVLVNWTLCMLPS